MRHAIPLGTLVERKDGTRLIVVEQTSEDGDPNYTLSHHDLNTYQGIAVCAQEIQAGEFFQIIKNGASSFANPESELTVIRLP